MSPFGSRWHLPQTRPCPLGAPPSPSNPVGPEAGNKPVPLGKLGILGKLGGWCPLPPPPCQARTKQDGEDARSPGMGMGGAGGAGGTRLSPQDATGGEPSRGAGRGAGTYREGGGGTKADLLHGAEQEAAGGRHATPALRPGQHGHPRARSAPASPPGRGPGLRQWEPDPPPPPPALPPSLPPSSAFPAPRIPASLHPCILASLHPATERGAPPRQGQAPRLVPVKVGEVAGGADVPPPVQKHPQISSWPPRRRTWHPPPCPGAKGGVDPPRLHLTAPPKNPQGGTPKHRGSPGAVRAVPVAAGHWELLRDVSRAAWGN